MLSHFEKPQPKSARPKVFAIYSFRHDHHLVPDLIANIEPIVDGWVAFDDRAVQSGLASETARHLQLVNRARELGADWVLAVDPDERLESQARFQFPSLTAHKRRIIWTFHYRELYSPTEYRVDGVWGKKLRGRLFPLFEGQVFSDDALHGPKYPIDAGYANEVCDLNLYHLKMITRERRVARRDLYSSLDPGNKYQAIGYDYLADDSAVVLETIPPDRMYLPPYREEGRQW